MPCVRQSASLSGMPVEPRLAAFRLASRFCFVDTRLMTAWAILSRTATTWVFRPPPSIQFVSPSLTASYTMFCTAGVPSSPLVWPLNWGSANVTLTAATMPSWTSVFSARSLPCFASFASFFVVDNRTSLTTLVIARSNPAT